MRRKGGDRGVFTNYIQTFFIKYQPPSLLFLPLLFSYFAELLSQTRTSWQSMLPTWVWNSPEMQGFSVGICNCWVWNMAQTPGVKSSLQRSFSEHVKDSTNKAWDVFWKSLRDRRLSGELGYDVHVNSTGGSKLGKGTFLQCWSSIMIQEFDIWKWEMKLKSSF